MACQCEESYNLITEQLGRIADALEASNAAAFDLMLTKALVESVVTDVNSFKDLQGYCNTKKMPAGTALKELVERLKAGYNA